MLNILKSFFTQSRKEDWIEERRSICKTCPLNSRNKKLKTREDFIWYILNLGSTFCTKCGCNVKRKTSLETAECPEKKWTYLI